MVVQNPRILSHATLVCTVRVPIKKQRRQHAKSRLFRGTRDSELRSIAICYRSVTGFLSQNIEPDLDLMSDVGRDINSYIGTYLVIADGQKEMGRLALVEV